MRTVLKEYQTGHRCVVKQSMVGFDFYVLTVDYFLLLLSDKTF